MIKCLTLYVGPTSRAPMRASASSVMNATTWLQLRAGLKFTRRLSMKAFYSIVICVNTPLEEEVTWSGTKRHATKFATTINSRKKIRTDNTSMIVNNDLNILFDLFNSSVIVSATSLAKVAKVLKVI